MERTNFQKLRICQLSEELTDNFEACINQMDATKREKYLKTYNERRFIHKRLKSCLAGQAEGTGRGSYPDNRRFTKLQALLYLS